MKSLLAFIPVLFIVFQTSLLYAQEEQTGETVAKDPRIDSIDAVIRASIVNIYRPLILNQHLPANLPRLERDAIYSYGDVGKQVIWTEIALGCYLKNKIDEWVQWKIKIHKYYPDLTDAWTCNNDAWFIFKSSNNPKHLKSALEWSHRAITLEPFSGNAKDTYANLLFKLGKKAEAIAMAEKAVSLEPENIKLKANLDKMRAGLKTW